MKRSAPRLKSQKLSGERSSAAPSCRTNWHRGVRRASLAGGHSGGPTEDLKRSCAPLRASRNKVQRTVPGPRACEFSECRILLPPCRNSLPCTRFFHIGSQPHFFFCTSAELNQKRN